MVGSRGLKAHCLRLWLAPSAPLPKRTRMAPGSYSIAGVSFPMGPGVISERPSQYLKILIIMSLTHVFTIIHWHFPTKPGDLRIKKIFFLLSPSSFYQNVFCYVFAGLSITFFLLVGLVTEGNILNFFVFFSSPQSRSVMSIQRKLLEHGTLASWSIPAWAWGPEL